MHRAEAQGVTHQLHADNEGWSCISEVTYRNFGFWSLLQEKAADMSRGAHRVTCQRSFRSYLTLKGEKIFETSC